jgi:hypothetical protein
VPLEPVQALILLAIVANLAVMAAVVLPALLGRSGSSPSVWAADDPRDHRAAEMIAVLSGPADDAVDPDGVPAGAYDRVVRIVSWVFILATFTIVALTGLWSETQPAIFALLAAAGMFVVVVHDLLPPGALGTAKFVLEGSVAITFATLLVVLTDNGAGYRSNAYRDTLATIGARHKRTRPWRPQTNGKAERVIQTLLREWAYGQPYTTNRERSDALPRFVDFYNRRRPHTALGGRSPLDAINNVLGDHI